MRSGPSMAATLWRTRRQRNRKGGPSGTSATASIGSGRTKSRKGLARALEQYGIAHRFVASRCADEGFSKPNPEMLLTLMERLGVEPARTLMIGDTSHDLELARNAGTNALAVAYGAHDPDAFERFSPVATVHSVSELRSWLASNA